MATRSDNTTSVKAAGFDFRVSADANADVWLSIFVGPLGGGQFISTAEARALAAALTAHADAAEAAQQVAA